MRRLLVLFGCSVLLWTLVSQLNNEISDWHIYLFVGGLYVAFAALTQPLAAGLVSSLLIGAVLDANTPVAFGTHLVLFAATHLVVFRLRDRVPRDDTVGRVTVAVLANLGLYLVFSVLQLMRTPAVAAVWPRMLFDLLCSQVFLALIAPWFFALQTRALVLARVERETFA